MTDRTPSRTSRAVATVRSGLARPHSPDGLADAQTRLCRGMVGGTTLSGPVRAHLRARTRFIDGQVLGALERGVDQVVIVGAGYDDRALRFRAPDVHYLELDHPSTQSDKARRLRAAGTDLSAVTLAAADFRFDDVDQVLAVAGHASDRPSLFIVEGLLVYLDEGTIMALLAGLRRRAATGSALVATLAVHPEGIDSHAVVARANSVRRWAGAEPWRTILPVGGHLQLLAGSGWVVTETVDDASLDTAATPERSLCVVAGP